MRGCAGWFESSLGAHIRKYVFSRCGSYISIATYSTVSSNSESGTLRLWSDCVAVRCLCYSHTAENADGCLIWCGPAVLACRKTRIYQYMSREQPGILNSITISHKLWEYFIKRQSYLKWPKAIFHGLLNVYHKQVLPFRKTWYTLCAKLSLRKLNTCIYVDRP